MTRTRYVLILAIALGVCEITAQQAKPTFEAASIRVRTGPDPAVSMGVATPGLFKRDSVTAQALVTYAYDLLPFEVAGGPDWIRTQRFEVVARMDEATSPPRVRQMVQSLLEERFQLKVHREAREMRSFTLLRNSPTRLGDFISPSKNCSEMVEMPQNVPPKAMRGAGCESMAGIARMIARHLSVPVIDGTKASGVFAFRMFYSPEGAAGPIEPQAPTYTNALQEQLGLRLEPRRGPVEILVIDSISQPTEN